MYKIIACDLDYTLVNSRGELTQKNIDAIKKASKMGVKFVPATGRGYFQAHPLLKTLDLFDKEEEYFCSFNGSLIVENHGQKAIYYNGGIPWDVVKKLGELSMKIDDIQMNFCTDQVMYRYYTPNRNFAFHEDKEDVAIVYEDLLKKENEHFIRLLIQTPSHERAEEVVEALNTLKDELTYAISANRYIEVVRKGTSKGQGVVSLAKALGVDMKDVIAIGDSVNDNSMIIAAGLGCCVANSSPETIAVSDYVCHNSNDEDAVAEIIEKFIF